MAYSDNDIFGKMGITGERAVRNALYNYRLTDYIYCHGNMPDNYQQGGGLDARRELLYYTVYSTRGNETLQKKEIDLIEEWMYSDDMQPHKKGHEVKGELASIQYHKSGSSEKVQQFEPLVFNYEPYKGGENGSILSELSEDQRQTQRQTGEQISKTRQLRGTGNIFIETKQGWGKGWASIICDTAEELKQMGFDEGRDMWSAALTMNNREVAKRAGVNLSEQAEPINTMILLAMPQQFIIDGIKDGNFKSKYRNTGGGYPIPFEDIFSISDATDPETGKMRWGWTDQRTGARLYEEEGILASFKGISEEWDEPDKEIAPICWINPCCEFNIALPIVKQIAAENRALIDKSIISTES